MPVGTSTGWAGHWEDEGGVCPTTQKKASCTPRVGLGRQGAVVIDKA